MSDSSSDSDESSWSTVPPGTGCAVTKEVGYRATDDQREGKVLFWNQGNDDPYFYPAHPSILIDVNMDRQEYLDKEVSFRIHGQPLPMERPRFNSHNHTTYSPSSPKIMKFREVVKEIIPSSYKRLVNVIPKPNTEGDTPGDTAVLYEPIFPHPEAVEVKLIFHMKRPDSHFVGNNRYDFVNNINERAGLMSGPDLDNLCKFVIDALEGVIYDNDKQVLKITSRKMYDTSSDEYFGYVDVTVCAHDI